MTETRYHKIQSLFCPDTPVVRSAVLRSAGFCGKDTGELVQQGKLQQVRRGYYALTAQTGFLTSFELLAALMPKGVISLFSAAQYHDLSTVIPQTIEITLPSNVRTPVLPENLHVTVYKSKNDLYTMGIENAQIENTTLKIYDRERTVCDFFRIRSKFGKDAALEVLKNYMAGRRNLQKLYKYATKLHIERIIHPYLEVLV